jgi:hypothetical protein
VTPSRGPGGVDVSAYTVNRLFKGEAMPIKARLLSAAFVGVLALGLALAVVNVSASRLSLNARSFRFVWSYFTVTEPGGYESVCPVTMEGSFHSSTFPKVSGSLLGYVNRATSGACSSGSATITSSSLPWHVRYRGFEGSLPSIGGMQLGIVGLGVTYREPFGITCRVRTTAEHPAVGSARLASGIVSNFMLDVSARIPAPGECAWGPITDFTFEGNASVSQAGTTASLLLSLIRDPYAETRLSPSLVEFGRPGYLYRDVAIYPGENLTVNSIRMRTGTRFSIRGNGCERAGMVAGIACIFEVRFLPPSSYTGTWYQDEVIVETTIKRLVAVVRALY